ncbi:MAG: hypothetical protein KGK12_09145, partial [Armatimonadetes bacterium]|nr:hypothetical protein [Armatimonadota bacterium]
MADSEISQVREQTEAQSAEEGHLPTEVTFEEGFSAKTVVGALFVGFIMLPGALYLGLIAGTSLGSAAEWVTIVLFAEIMRRSFLPMKRQEIYILFYIAASLTGLDTSKGLSGGQFAGLIWNQYFVQSPNAAMVSRQIPHWVVPPAGSPALLHRTFFDHAWLIPIALMLLVDLLGRVNSLCAGYFLFRVTSDIERLPFPMAPIAASGATALAEAASKEESWRWRVFSVGTVIGLVFSVFYIAIPVFTGVAFGKAWTLLPIPFLDLTRNTESLLPGAVSGLSCDLGGVLVGFVIPYPIVVGTFWGCMLTRVGMAPVLYHFGLFGNSDNSGWTPGMNGIYTKQITDIKFWMAIGIGLQLAVAAIGIWMVIRTLSSMRNTVRNRGMRRPLPAGRGDLPLWIPVLIWFTITVTFLCICDYLLHVDSTPTENHAIFPVWLLVFYGLVWSPVQSYISARMIGITGSGVSFPYMQQVSIMKSGYP